MPTSPDFAPWIREQHYERLTVHPALRDLARLAAQQYEELKVRHDHQYSVGWPGHDCAKGDGGCRVLLAAQEFQEKYSE